MNTNIRKKERDTQNEELRNHLCAQIETEWNENRNADLVDELAFQHPEMANELYEFFALLVEIELENENGGNGVGAEDESDDDLAGWLESEGFEIALRASAETCRAVSTLPTDSDAAANFVVQEKPANGAAVDSAQTGKVAPYETFLRKAQKREGLKAREFAKEIDAPLPLILFAEENFDSQFDPLRDELSDRYARRFNRDRREARESFRPVAMAAKTGKTTMARDNAETIVKKLSKSEQKFWLKLLGFMNDDK